MWITIGNKYFMFYWVVQYQSFQNDTYEKNGWNLNHLKDKCLLCCFTNPRNEIGARFPYLYNVYVINLFGVLYACSQALQDIGTFWRIKKRALKRGAIIAKQSFCSFTINKHVYSFIRYLNTQQDWACTKGK